MADNAPVENAESGSHVRFFFIRSIRIITGDTKTVESFDGIIIDVVTDNTEYTICKMFDISPIGSHTVLPPEEVIIDV